MRTLTVKSRIAALHILLAIMLVASVSIEAAHEHPAQVADACYACQLSPDLETGTTLADVTPDWTAIGGVSHFTPSVPALSRYRHHTPRGPPFPG